MLPRLILLAAAALHAAPQPGDIYREYPFAMGGAGAWRVTDPDAGHPGAQQHLPNDILRFAIDDLKGAQRAEIEIDRWGGHPGTAGKRLRVNSNAWIVLPDPVSPCYMVQDRPVVEIPVSQLRQGDNTLEGTAGDQVCHSFRWGQWGWYGGVVRVYYDRAKQHAEGSIASPARGAAFDDNPPVRVNVKGEASRVDILAFYEGIDENGDGEYGGWHETRHYSDLAGHAGSTFAAPWSVRWNTSWIPDQPAGSVKLVARIRDRRGYWYVTPIVEGLTLRRRDVSVKLLRPEGVPERYWVRADRRAESRVALPDAGGWTQAALVLRTWNGRGEQVRVNEWTHDIGGLDHNFTQSMIDLPVSELKAGPNTVEFHSTTEHHGVEVMWPGPQVLVRRGPPAAVDAQPSWLSSDLEGRIRLRVTAGRIATGKLRLPPEADPATVRVARYSDPELTVLKDGAVPWQLDGDELTIDSRGAEHFAIYFARRGRGVPAVPVNPLVTMDEGVMHQEQMSLRITSAGSTWLYHAEGAGLASLYDKDGNDWISYRPGNRAAGEFRGIPNLGAFAHPGYTGERGSRTTVERRGPLVVRVRSEGVNGQGALYWDFLPGGQARLTVERTAEPFWFLYEGTPAGRLDLLSGYWGAADGVRRTFNEVWNGDLPGDPEWVYFGDRSARRALYLINHTGDSANDQFWEMNTNMTVFGFGRQYRCCGKYLTAPRRFTVGFAETDTFDGITAAVKAALQEGTIQAGEVEWIKRP